ncbi:MAG TPA: cytochrome c-type biogenesis protein CcmH [Vicinamibacteria bacterium]|nr:cytochrome c-type biogenesis protein CcmH [Vicinamibacteria bacterium]
MRARLGFALLVGLTPALALPAAQATSAPDELPGIEDAAERLGPPGARPLSGAELEAETKRVSALLRCPVCQGLSVADSPATLAVNMRNRVRELLAAGYAEQQVLTYFEGAYGEFVRLDPPVRGVNWTLWLAPLGALLLGSLVVFWMMRAPKAPGDVALPAERPAAAADPLPDDAELAQYVLRVREQVYGWPGGVRPAKTGS